MSLFQRSRSAKRRDPKHNPPRNRPEPDAPILISSVTKVGSTLTLVFDQQVNLEGTPAITTDIVGATPVSAVKTNPTTVAITYSAPIAAATRLNLTYGDRAIRNVGGGYLFSPTFPLAA